MDNRVRVARELVKVAKDLVGARSEKEQFGDILKSAESLQKVLENFVDKMSTSKEIDPVKNRKRKKTISNLKETSSRMLVVLSRLNDEKNSFE